QHSLWGYLTKGHELYDKQLKNYIFQKFYKSLDFCIEILVEEFRRIYSSEILTIILSDHGFEDHQKQFFLGDWLYQKGLLSIKGNSIKSIIRRKFKEFIEKLNIGYTQTKILKLLNYALKYISKTKKINLRVSEVHSIVDMKSSIVFSMGIGLYGYIFILNEEKYHDKILNYLKVELNKLKDPETNRTIVKNLYIKKEIYKGEKPHLIPDLIIQPENGYSFVGLYKGKRNLLEKINIKESETIGKHSEEGILLVNGNGVKPQKLVNYSLRDITPTILDYFNIPLPNDLDGKKINYT
ncbi:MAG: alkaline phosphatase family protein, partial [Promethearchaeota archaeon]